MLQSTDSRNNSSQSTIAQRALQENLGAKDIRSLLPILGFQPVVTGVANSQAIDQAAPFYVHNSMVVLAPSTDNPNKSQCGLFGVEANVTNALSHQAQGSTNFLRGKDLVIFPVYEEWNSRAQFSPRLNWVLFVYVQSRSKIYLLDYTGPFMAGLYKQNLRHIEKALKNALGMLDYPIDNLLALEAVYLDRRESMNENSSGFWIAYILYRLNQGSDVARLKQELASVTLGRIKQVLTHIPQTSQEIQDNVENSITPNQSSTNITNVSIQAAVPLFETQDYARPGTHNLDLALPSRAGIVESLVSSGSSIRRTMILDGETANSPTFWSRFHWDVYSKLILSGMVTAALALLCLAMTSPVLSATISTGILGLGVTMFVGGMLGKFGVFSGGSSSTPPSNAHTSVLSLSTNATA